MASEADYLSARLGILAETVRTYLDLVNLRYQQNLADEIVQILLQRQSLAESRYDRGLVDSHGLHEAQRNLLEAQSRLPQIEAFRADAEGRLWVLTGGRQEDLEDKLTNSPDPPRNLPAVLEPVPAGIPADLVVQRPDVRAAMRRVEAARYSLSARRADQFPRLSLQGSIGLQNTDPGNWFDANQWFQNLSLNVISPAFQGSRLRSNVALARARLNETVAAFGRSVVTAVNEVETALVRLKASRQNHSLSASLSEVAEAELSFQEQRYTSGVGSYEAFLTAALASSSARAVLAMAVRDLGYARLALHRALGGSWTANGRRAPEHTQRFLSRSPTG